MPRVVISRGTNFFKEYVFSGVDIITLGRGRSNDIFLPDASRRVSRLHAALVRAQAQPERYFLRDLSSLRGTKVNSEIALQRLLLDGDVVAVADYELSYFSQVPERQRFSRLSVAPKQLEAAATDKSTILFTHAELMQEIPVSAGRREVLEEVLRRAGRVTSLAELLEQTAAAIIRAVPADRGFAALFTPDGLFEEAGAAGLRPDEQIEVSDAEFLDRVRQGEEILDGSTLLAPILLHEQAKGFFCVDRVPPTEPFTPEEASFLLTMGRLAAGHALETRGSRRKARSEETPLEWPVGMVGKSKPMSEVFQQIREAAAAGLNVLLVGENGTGKELAARAIHRASANAGGPFVARNCAEVTETLADTEIFGYAPKCGIAGAKAQGAPGWFELANQGSLFLDEVQALSPAVQDKFLRVLQEKEVLRYGAERPVPVDVNVIAATDQELEAAAELGSFRKALYYRFGKQIRLPPLGERREEIPLLVHYFLDRFAVQLGSRARLISHRALQHLARAHWPGNVRQLENCIKAAVTKHPDKDVLLLLDFAELPEATAKLRVPDTAPPALAVPAAEADGVRPIRETEREEIMEALEATRGNITKAAKLLGYKSRQTMLNKMDKYGIPRRHGDPDQSQ
jgi:DNA-binding NtrC family response regulator